MSTPHKCPKCDGLGYLQYDPNMPYTATSTSCGPWQCNACVNGIIWSVDSEKRMDIGEMPAWTKITDVKDMPENWWDYTWAWKSTGDEWVRSTQNDLCKYYLIHGKVGEVYYRPICGLDFPPGDKS